MLNHQEELRFCKARRGAIAREFSQLNPEQQKAVLATEGPLLLLAGAGSRKTTVLINRIANLMKYGRGEVTCLLRGLGEMEPIQQLFVEHAQAAMDSLSK